MFAMISSITSVRGTKSAAFCLIVPILLACTTSATAQWPQWGGPNRNFMTAATGLADKWPAEGPPVIWKRDLGDGYTTIVVDSNRLFTMYRDGEEEVVIAMDAKTGKTIWEYKYDSSFTELMEQFGAGPHSTPLIIEDRLYTMGINVVMHCLDANTGKVVWKHDLVEEYGAPIPGRGYSCSPIAYKNTVIVPVGGDGQGVIAFNRKNGGVVWKSQDFQVTHASPILIEQGGMPQLVVFMGTQVAGLNPDDGKMLWSHPHKTQYGANLATPLWDGKDLIFTSSAYDSGSRVIKLLHKDGKTVPKELWYSRKMRIHHGNAIRIGDYLYGSSGDFGPAFFMGININSGKVAWRKRGFAKATCVYGGDKLIILDEDGKLALATVSPDGINILSQCKLTERYSWAAPTLVGKTLYLRDRKQILALDLG